MAVSHPRRAGLLVARIGVVLVIAFVAAWVMTVEAQASAVVQADEPPSLSITHFTDRSTAINPGDTVEFTVDVTNVDSSQQEVTVRIDYDQTVFASVEARNVEQTSIEDDGDALVWTLDRLAAGATESMTYGATAAGNFPADVTVVVHTASVMTDADGTVASAAASVPIAASQAAAAAAPRPVTDLSPYDIKFILVVVILATTIVLVVITIISGRKFLESAEFDAEAWRKSTTVILDLLAVVVIVAAVLILAVRGSIGEDGTVSILAGIAGYVLGRVGRAEKA
jgi:hypothetical protein